MTLCLFDTMTRRLRPVEPLEAGHVRMYTCGPTVYARQHIGNYRTFIFEDVLRRWLERRFDRVTQVMNLTDVEDKIIRNAIASGRTLEEETAPHVAAFFEDLDSLGIRRAHHYPRATEYVAEMVDLIDRLGERGLTYTTDGSIYYRIAGFPNYGRLSGARAEGLVAGAGGRVDADEYTKDDVRDFALWKSVEPGQMGWDTRLGRGRPGWHIECSAMSISLLGESFDLHCGGVDNIFPHHENEIAQSEGATGKPFVTAWAHGAHLRIGGEKMAKSAGNFATLPEILRSGASPAAVRYLLAASAHYRKTLNYSDDALHMAAEAVERLAEFRDRLVRAPGGDVPTPAAEAALTTGRAEFEAALDDDLNLPEAMGSVFSTIREVNRLLDQGSVPGPVIAGLRDFVADVDDVLGVLPLVDRERSGVLSPSDRALLDERVRAREVRDWAASDRLRDQLAARGILAEDTPAGQRWRRAAVPTVAEAPSD